MFFLLQFSSLPFNLSLNKPAMIGTDMAVINKISTHVSIHANVCMYLPDMYARRHVKPQGCNRTLQTNFSSQFFFS